MTKHSNGTCVACGNPSQDPTQEHFVVATASDGVSPPEDSRPQRVEAPHTSKVGDNVSPSLADRIADCLVEDHIALMRENLQLRGQLAECEKQIVLLREALEYAWRPTYETNGITGARMANEALAATDDLSGYILCEREPVGYIFQHEDTGRTMCVEAQQVEWNFEKNNPRLFKVGPLYAPKGLNHGN